jgi:hypothetical protein
MLSDFSVVAIVAAFNEADVIAPVVADLIDQGLQVYFLDDGSTDGTVAAIEPFLGRGVRAIERLRPPSPANDSPFNWERILARKSELSRELDADWFLHHDADEFRESPWVQLTLKDAIHQVDSLGFNAIDFASFDFWPVHDDFRAGEDVRDAFPYYAAGAAYDRLQIRCWKKTGADVDLVSSGGHEAIFPGRQVFPLRFIARHYPIRGEAHAQRKIFDERLNRLRAEERGRGWHVQYDDVVKGAPVIRDRSALTPYDPQRVRAELMLRHRGLEALESEREELLALADAQRAELAARAGDLEAHRRELDVRDARIDELARALEQSQAALSASNEALADAGARLEQMRAEQAALNDRHDHQARQIAGLEGAVREGTRRIDDLHQSLSWRWTSPARAAYRLLKGR